MSTVVGNFELTSEEVADQLALFVTDFKQSRLSGGNTRLTNLLDQLGSDIRSGKNLNGWHRLDLEDVVESMVTPRWYSRWVVRFGMLLPIGLNWWSIREATSAYSLLRQDQLSEKSFLFWWVQGMDGKLWWWEKLPNVAMLTVAIIAALSFAGLIVGWPQQRLLRRLSDSLLVAQFHIGRRVAFSPEEIRGAVSLLLAEMLEAGTTLRENSEQSLEISERITEQFDSLKEFVSDQTDLVGGELKTAVVASTNAAKELVKTVEGNQALVDTLSAGSQALKESITPIREMILGAGDLATSSESAAKTLKTMVEDVPNSFIEPLGLMMSAVELLTEGTAAVMNQMEGLESLSAIVGNGDDANEIKILLEKLISSSEEIAKERGDIRDTVDNFSQDLRLLLESIDSLKRAIDRWEK
jgi:hypothetical protein